MSDPNFNGRNVCHYPHSHKFKDEVYYPITRLFDDRRKKRKVKVSIRVWPCGVHYYVKLKLEDNLAWDGECWATWPDDKDGKGETSEGRFPTMRQAKEFIQREMEKPHFRGYKLWKDSAMAEKALPTGWLYKYEGD